jgi:hypothetical protein
MLGDVYQTQQPTLFVADGVTTTYTATVATPMSATGTIQDQQGSFTVSFSNGVLTGTGLFSSGTINYATGAISLTFTTPPLAGDRCYATYIQAIPYRVAWSAIGDPTNWPVPLTNAAIGFQSGINDLQPDLGQIMFIAGYPLYALIFQKTGITRAQYIGGNVVWSWQPFEFKRGCVAHGAAIKVGPRVYFLADDGFYVTDGASVVPIGTTSDNSQGIDRWLWQNINTGALESIRAGYDAGKRCVFFAIPTGQNTLPDTLLTYNPLAQRWTKSQVSTETIWTADDGSDGNPGTRQSLGVIDQTHTPNLLSGTSLTGYLESCDVFYVDGNRRTITGARPHATGATPALVTVGARNGLQDSVLYSTPTYVNQFSKVASVFLGGMYTRVKVQYRDANLVSGATLSVVKQGPI